MDVTNISYIIYVFVIQLTFDLPGWLSTEDLSDPVKTHYATPN